MHNGHLGADVTRLQRQLIDAGFKLAADGWFGPATDAALIAFQRRAGLVADGIAGPKTRAALATRERDPRRLSESDLEQAAERLAVDLAALKAINRVESSGNGFLEDGRPVILYERHVAFRLLGETGIDFDTACQMANRYPNVLGQQRGGYVGGSAEWSRLATACHVMPGEVAQAACSWGQFQIMGYHWQSLGYESLAAFVAAMHASEAAQLDAFVRFIEADPALAKALRGRKWADFARRYNGPDYKANAYDTRLATAYARYGSAA